MNKPINQLPGYPFLLFDEPFPWYVYKVNSCRKLTSGYSG